VFDCSGNAKAAAEAETIASKDTEKSLTPFDMTMNSMKYAIILT
jgi:hypothetical protein